MSSQSFSFISGPSKLPGLNPLSPGVPVLLEDQPGESKNLCSESIALRKISKIDQRKIRLSH
jgi:hypothetical protein